MVTQEQRRSPRKLVVLAASLLRDDADFFRDEVKVQTVNLSRTGALVQSAEQLYPGEICTLTLPKPKGGFGDIPARVVWVEREPAGSYRAGIEFRNLSPDEEYLVDLHRVPKK